MYVELKTPPGGKKYVYLKRSVRDGEKIRHMTVERYGEQQKLEDLYPGFVDQLTQLSEEGSHLVLQRKLISLDRKFDNALEQDYEFVFKTKAEPTQFVCFDNLVAIPCRNLVTWNQQQGEDGSPLLTTHTSSIDDGGAAAQALGYIQVKGVNFKAAYSSKFDIDMLFDTPEAKHIASLEYSQPVTRLFADQQEVLAHTYAPNYEFGVLDELIASTPAYSSYPAFSGKDLLPVERECLYPVGFVDAVVVAAGVGKRMGSAIPKQYLKVDDKCILEHSVLKLLICPYVRRVILVLSPEDEYLKFTCLGDLKDVTVVHGGEQRVDSVLAGLAAVETPWAIVHDAARPLLSIFDVERLMYSVACGQAAGFSGGLLVSKVADSLKLSDHGEDSTGTFPAVKQTVDRNRMYRAQTPQLFKTEELKKAIAKALTTKPGSVTDEASAMELTGNKVMLVEGSPLNFKITEPADYLMLKALMSYCVPKY